MPDIPFEQRLISLSMDTPCKIERIWPEAVGVMSDIEHLIVFLRKVSHK